MLKQVEMLYQRYFLRINQTNMTHLLGLLLAVALGLLGVKARTLLLAQDLLPEIDLTLGTDLPPIYRCVDSVNIYLSHNTYLYLTSAFGVFRLDSV